MKKLQESSNAQVSMHHVPEFGIVGRDVSSFCDTYTASAVERIDHLRLIH